MKRSLLLVLWLALGSGCPAMTNAFGGGGATVLVDDAQGISAGGQVRVHGVVVGRITEVTLEPEGARIAIDDLANVVLRSDACALLRTHAPSDVYLEIRPGHAEDTLASGETLAECASSSLENAGVESIGELTGLVRELRAYVALLERGDRPLCTVQATSPAPTPAQATPTEAAVPPTEEADATPTPPQATP